MAVSSYLKDGKKLYLVLVKVRDKSGKQILKRQAGISSEKKARDIEFEMRRSLEESTVRKPLTRWKDWFDHCVERMRLELRGSTVQNYESIVGKWVTPIWKNKEIQEISRTDVHQLIFKQLGESATAHTRQSVLKMVKRILQMAYDEEIIDRNPCVGISVKVPDSDLTVLSAREVEIFLTQAKIVGHRFYPVWAVALMTGMRSGELFALSWSSVDFDSKLIRVHRSWCSKVGFVPTKTSKCRVVPISEELLRYLKVLKLQTESSGFVLPRLGEWAHGEQALVTRDFCLAAGVTVVRFHDLRATFITNLLAKGVSLARVMAIVGHSEIKTTNGYLRKAGVDLQGVTDELGYSLPSESEAKVLMLSSAWNGGAGRGR